MAAHTRIGVGYNVQVAVDTKHKLIVEQQVTNQVVDMGLLTQTATPAKEVLGVETVIHLICPLVPIPDWQTAYGVRRRMARGIESNTWNLLFTTAMIFLRLLVNRNGRGSRLHSAKKRLMAV
jgi:hypothetical protein